MPWLLYRLAAMYTEGAALAGRAAMDAMSCSFTLASAAGEQVLGW